MIVFALIMWVMIILIFQAGLQGNQNSVDVNRNISLYNLITDDELDTWLQESPINTTDLSMGKHSQVSSSMNLIDNSDKNDTDDNSKIFPSALSNQQLSDDPNQTSFPEDILEILLSNPSHSVDPDWNVVLGNFEHYGDENWYNYLVQTEVPVLVRWYLSDAPESVFIYRIFTNSKGDELISVEPKKSSHDFKVVIETGSWILTHENKFKLGQAFVEADLDGTNSENMFFFSSPRLLVHNKIKEKWKTTIVRHFDETGLNMTFIDRERMVVARRYLKRIS